MNSEIFTCTKCGREYDVNYSKKNECEIVSGRCNCRLQNRKTGLNKSHIKTLDRAMELLNGEFKRVPRKISRKS